MSWSLTPGTEKEMLAPGFTNMALAATVAAVLYLLPNQGLAVTMA